jgi:hypothetical protein
MADNQNNKENVNKEGKKKLSKEERIASRNAPKVCLIKIIVLFFISFNLFSNLKAS